MDRCFLDKNWKGWEWSTTSLPRFIDISLKKPKERKNAASAIAGYTTQSMYTAAWKRWGRILVFKSWPNLWRSSSSPRSQSDWFAPIHSPQSDEMQGNEKREILSNPDLILPKEASPMIISQLLPLSEEIHFGERHSVRQFIHNQPLCAPRRFYHKIYNVFVFIIKFMLQRWQST